MRKLIRGIVEFREKVLPKSVTKRVSVEAASTFGWDRFTGFDGACIGIDHYGASAPGDRIMKEFRARFIGKCSPVHLFWGALDLAVTRVDDQMMFLAQASRKIENVDALVVFDAGQRS